MDVEVLKKEIIDVTAKRVAEGLENKFVTVDEMKKALESLHQTTPEEKMTETEEKFWKDIASGVYAKATGDITDTSTAGTLVPSTVASKILDQLQAASYIRKICTVFPDDKGTLFVKSQGATAYRTAENTAPNNGTPSTLAYNAVTYEGYDVAADTLISNKLLKLAKPNLRQFVYTQLGQAFANLELVEFITGSGTNSFTGLNNAGITAVIAASGHTAITDIDYDDLLSLFLAVPQQYRAKSSWIITSTLEGIVMKLKDSNGIPIFNPNAGTIMGKPYYINDNIATSGTTDPIAYFGYWKDYFIFDKGGISVLTTNQGKELMSKRQTYMIAFASTDGKPVDTKGMRALKLASA